MYCPVCKAENSNEVSRCEKCGFVFSSPGGKNFDRIEIIKLVFSPINIGVIILALLALIGLVWGVLFWKFFGSSDSWTLAVQSIGGKTKLHALNWETKSTLVIGESQGNWTAPIHIAFAPPPQTEIFQARHYGLWTGGGAIYSPRTNKVIATFRLNDQWQVNITDLDTKKKTVLLETTTQPFISVAPEHALTAVSIPATEENSASLNVFFNTEKLEIGQPLAETLSPTGILAPNGQHLLYTVSTQTTTNTQRVYHTAIYAANLGNGNENIVYEFDHNSQDTLDNLNYSFTPNSQAVIYQTPDRELYQIDLVSLDATQIYTPAETTSIVYWTVTPESDQIALFLDNSGKVNGPLDFLLISLNTGQETILDQAFQPERIASLIFLDETHIFYSPRPTRQAIYDLATGTPENFDVSSGASLRCPVMAKDRSLIGFTISDSQVTDFDFYSLFKGDVVPALDFNVSSNSVNTFDFLANYVLFESGGILYLKNILNRNQPIRIKGNSSSAVISALLTPNSRYLLLQTRDSSGQTDIYRVNLKNQQNTILLYHAQLLTASNNYWCQN